MPQTNLRQASAVASTCTKFLRDPYTSVGDKSVHFVPLVASWLVYCNYSRLLITFANSLGKTSGQIWILYLLFALTISNGIPKKLIFWKKQQKTTQL